MTGAPKVRKTSSRPQDSTAAAQLDQALLKATYAADWVSVVSALEAGADIEYADPETGLSALHLAIGTNNLALTRMLLEDCGARIKPDGQGRWPSVIAARCGVDDDLADFVVEAEERAAETE